MTCVADSYILVLMQTNSIISNPSNSSLVSSPREATLQLVEIMKRQVVDFIRAGEIFKLVHDNQWWKQEGAHSFNSYVAEIGYDRGTAYKMMLVYETFGKSVESLHNLLEVGWAKLAKVAPHVNKDNYSYMLELASSNSLSDIDEELVKQHYITKLEPHPEFTDCPFCGKSFEIKRRRDEQFPQEDYKRVIEAYIKAKEIEPKGDEYRPIQQAIKTMFMNGRTPDEIIATIEYVAEQDYIDWTIRTIQNKIAEILPKLDIKPKEIKEEDRELLKGVGIE